MYQKRSTKYEVYTRNGVILKISRSIWLYGNLRAWLRKIFDLIGQIHMAKQRCECIKELHTLHIHGACVVLSSIFGKYPHMDHMNSCPVPVILQYKKKQLQISIRMQLQML